MGSKNKLTPVHFNSTYDNGEGVPKDAVKAVEWWQKAAAQGNEIAQESLKLLPANRN